MRYCLVVICLFLLSSCEKDEPIKDDLSSGNCRDFPMMARTFFTESRFQYKAPCFNPENPNEFVYYYKDNEQRIYQLITYNLETGKKTILTNTDKIYGQPRWGSSGWIANTRKQGYVDHIFIVKENGDSLSQFTSVTANLSPFWNNSKNELLWTHSPDLGAEWYLLGKTLYSEDVDTLSSIWGGGAVDISNGKVLHKKNINGTPFYGYFNLSDRVDSLTDDEFVKISNLKGATGGISWHSSGSFFYVSHVGGDNRGLYKVSLQGASERLMRYCDTKRYSIMSCSSDGKYIVAERIDSSLGLNENNQPTGEIIEESSIWLIDTKTLEEKKIELN
ncbi:hypothetical protein [Salibacter sp.]|uniref:TolB family protein n=1 Tax=Salibacter sp. TaxID=2010995 RepID=UPI00287028C7|nr:hypothetical protein [Salibacter sp.]MDR9486737.1 hypothetical protein [Salibacter sp.]